MNPRPTLVQHVRSLAASRALRQVVGLCLAYVLLGWWFEHETTERGLFDAAGHLHVFVVILGLFTLLVRIATRFLVPATVAFVLVDRLARHVFPGRPMVPPADDPRSRPGS
jgi:hypothetical protein